MVISFAYNIFFFFCPFFVLFLSLLSLFCLFLSFVFFVSFCLFFVPVSIFVSFLSHLFLYFVFYLFIFVSFGLLRQAHWFPAGIQSETLQIQQHKSQENKIKIKKNRWSSRVGNCCVSNPIFFFFFQSYHVTRSLRETLVNSRKRHHTPPYLFYVRPPVSRNSSVSLPKYRL